MAIDLTGGLPIEREYVFAKRPGPEVRDAVNFWIEGEKADIAMRIGVEAVAEEWDKPQIWLDIAFPDGRVLSSRDYFPRRPAIGPEGLPTIRGAGPVALRCVKPFEHWRASFDEHPVTELTVDQLLADARPAKPPLRRTSFEIDIYPAVPPLISGTLTAESRAQMDGEEGSFLSPRYEQQCRVEGQVTIDGVRHAFKGQGNRIKRQGVRKFEGFWGHCWMAGLFPSGKAFMVNTFPPRGDGKPSFNEGYVFDGDGVLKPARAVQIPWMRKLVARDEDVPLVLETADGLVSIEGTTFINCRSLHDGVLPATFPIVQQSHARYRWDGEETTGMIERSTLQDQLEV